MEKRYKMKKILIIVCLLFSNLVSANELQKILSDAGEIFPQDLLEHTDDNLLE